MSFPLMNIYKIARIEACADRDAPIAESAKVGPYLSFPQGAKLTSDENCLVCAGRMVPGDLRAARSAKHLRFPSAGLLVHLRKWVPDR